MAASAEALAQDHADVWDSGKVDSDQSVNVPYGGPSPESRRRYYWQVRVWDAQGQPSPYSAATWWEMGLLSSQDWKASALRERSAAVRKKSARENASRALGICGSPIKVPYCTYLPFELTG